MNKADFLINSGGLNTADSPFVVEPGQATGGMNFDYILKGGFRKRAGHSKLNSTADTETLSLGLTLWDKPGSAREVIRSANRKIQKINQDTAAITNLTEDTVTAGSNFWASSTTIPVVSSMFNTADSGVNWMVGGGSETIWGVYSDSKVTANGVALTAGTTSATVSSSSGGTWSATGVYRYAFALYKASTEAVGNAPTATECSVTVATNTDTVTITLSSLSAIDTTKYTKLYIYRSAAAGVEGFTTGALVKQLDISSGVPSTTTDLGTSLSSPVSVPRSTSTTLDNGALPSGLTWTGLTTWKRRLVTAANSTVYLSDINKPESWPSLNTIDIPSGGDITGLAIISLNTPFSSGVDELLCVFKQRELWVITGNALDDWALKFIDNSGCPNQPLAVAANGYLTWVGYRGVYLWDGAGKPAYLSQQIEDKFQRNGDIDKSELIRGFGLFAQDRNEVQWYLSSSEFGTQKLALKLDLRLTLGDAQAGLNGRMVRGVFTPDVQLVPMYAGMSFLASESASEETIYLADNGGFIYNAYSNTSDIGTSYTMQYSTPYLDMGQRGVAKRIHKLILWVKDTGSFNIDLDYWSDYRYEEGDASSRSLPVSPLSSEAAGVWDVGIWDESTWDSASQRIRPLTFNLSSTDKNNSDGDAFRFRFSQTGQSETVIIYGFTVLYTDMSVRK